MKHPNAALIDAGPLIAFYDAGDVWHAQTLKFFENYRGQLITSGAVITEVMWLLASDNRVQNEFLNDLYQRLYTVEPFVPQDFEYIKSLNLQYRDMSADFADLSIVAISVRLGIKRVVSLDSDFDIYKCSGRPFEQLFPRWD